MTRSRDIKSLRHFRVKLPKRIKGWNKPRPLIPYLAELVDKDMVIADVAAGPICSIGDHLDGYDIQVIASDYLADKYVELWTEQPIVPIEQEDMTALSYPDETFDISHCSNALDHCEDPWRAVKELVRVSKRYVVLRHRENQAERRGYWGQHEWNMERNGRMWSKTDEVNLKNIDPRFRFTMQDGWIMGVLDKCSQ